MTIQREDHGKKGIFYLEVDGERQALMTYTWAGTGKMIIDHTEVDAGLRGQRVGYKLVEQAVAYAREQHIKILPLCPFAKAVFDKTKAYADVLF